VRFFVDECIGASLVTELRDRGHDVVWAQDDHATLPDNQILAFATQENRVLISEDRDFGTLVFGRRQPAIGIIIVHVSDFLIPATALAALVADVIAEQQGSLVGCFLTIEPGRVRARFFGPTPKDER
jgi:predicted nuclease of predicted toxin-antitoxin system